MASLFDDETDGGEGFALDDKVAELEAETGGEILPPRANPDLSGHEAVEKALLADYNAGRLPHAIILAGPAGIGKATLAYRLARFLLAEGGEKDAGLFGDAAPPETLYVSPENPVFRRVASGGHADLLTVEREFDEKRGRLKNDISVESVRRVHPFLRKTAAEGGWRVVIVDSAEHLNTSSQNALLKILEEPPKKTLLVLTTSQPGGFLPTIRSRCRTVRMEALDDSAVSALLDKMAPGIGGDEKSILLRLAGGAIGRALQFHQEDGAALYRDLLKTASTLPALDMVAVHGLAEKIGRYGAEQAYETATEILTHWCATQARRAARGEAPGAEAETAARLAQIYPPQHFFRTWERMTELFRQTEIYNLDKKQAVIGAFLMLKDPNYRGLAL